jgi:hypothetical protein
MKKKISKSFRGTKKQNILEILSIDLMIIFCSSEGGPILLIRPRIVYTQTWGMSTLGRVKDEKSQLGITAICFFGTILHGETEFTALLMF